MRHKNLRLQEKSDVELDFMGHKAARYGQCFGTKQPISYVNEKIGNIDN